MVDESLMQHTQELFQAIFASDFELTNGQPITQQAFRDTIAMMDPSEEEKEEFENLLTFARKQPDGRISKPDLLDAIYEKFKPVTNTSPNAITNAPEGSSNNDHLTLQEDCSNFYSNSLDQANIMTPRRVDHSSREDLVDMTMDMQKYFSQNYDQITANGDYQIDLDRLRNQYSNVKTSQIENFLDTSAWMQIEDGEVARVLTIGTGLQTITYKQFEELQSRPFDLINSFELSDSEICHSQQKQQQITTTQNDTYSSENNNQKLQQQHEDNTLMGQQFIEKIKAHFNDENQESMQPSEAFLQIIDTLVDQNAASFLRSNSLQDIFQILQKLALACKVSDEDKNYRMKNLQEEGTEIDCENRKMIEDLQKENDWLSAFKDKYVEQEHELKELKEDKIQYESMYSQMVNELDELKLQLATMKTVETESMSIKKQMEILQLENRKLRQMVQRKLGDQSLDSITTLSASADANADVSDSDDSDFNESQSEKAQIFGKKLNESVGTTQSTHHLSSNSNVQIKSGYNNTADTTASPLKNSVSEVSLNTPSKSTSPDNNLLNNLNRINIEKLDLQDRLLSLQEKYKQKKREAKQTQKQLEKETIMVTYLQTELTKANQKYKTAEAITLQTKENYNQMSEQYQSLQVENKRLQDANHMIQYRANNGLTQQQSASQHTFIESIHSGFTQISGISANNKLNSSIMGLMRAGNGIGSAHRNNNTSIMDLDVGGRSTCNQSMMNMSSKRPMSVNKKSKMVMSSTRMSSKYNNNSKTGNVNQFATPRKTESSYNQTNLQSESHIIHLSSEEDSQSQRSDSDNGIICVEEMDQVEKRKKKLNYPEMFKLSASMQRNSEVIPEGKIYKEGDSEADDSQVGDSEYDDEVVEIENLDEEEEKVEFDIMGILQKDSPYHEPILKHINKYTHFDKSFQPTYKLAQKKAKQQSNQDTEESKQTEAVEDLLTCDQAFPVFADECRIFQAQKEFACLLVIHMEKVYIVYQQSKQTVYSPFELSEVRALIMSPSNPLSAALQLKDDRKIQRSHVVFQNKNMGLLVRYFQDLQLYDLKVQFMEQIALTIYGKPTQFDFNDIMVQKAKQQNAGLVNCQMQGYLSKLKKQFLSMFAGDTWDQLFFVLTNVGLLIFEGDNFLNPSRLVPLQKMKIEKLTKKQLKTKDFGFKLTVGQDEVWTLAAQDKNSCEQWIETINQIVSQCSNKTATTTNLQGQRTGK